MATLKKVPKYIVIILVDSFYLLNDLCETAKCFSTIVPLECSLSVVYPYHGLRSTVYWSDRSPENLLVKRPVWDYAVAQQIRLQREQKCLSATATL